MLDDTLVVWGGEFGITNYCQGKIQAGFGRDHHPRCFSIWMAGGGIKSGSAFGQSCEFGYNVAEDGVHIHDLQATMMHLLGMWRESWRDLWVYYFIDSSIGDKSSRSLFFILHFSGRKNHPGWKLECCSKLSSSSKLQAPRTSKCKIQKKIGLILFILIYKSLIYYHQLADFL